jgi:hypothetical protein
MSKTKGQKAPISFWKQNQNVVVPLPNLSLLKTDFFDLVQNLVSNSDVLVSFLLEIGMFVERCGTFVEPFFLYCFDITSSQYSQGGTTTEGGVNLDKGRFTGFMS